MHMFAPERPNASPGQKALLIDGSAIPRILVTPQPNGYMCVAAMLNNYDAHGGYSWREREMHPFGLMTFFRAYAEDPEFALHHYFDWTPQPRTRAMVIDNRETGEAQDYVNALL